MKRYLLTISVLLSLIFANTLFPGGVAFADASGTCGSTGVTWSYTTSDNKLTISYSGSGSSVMPDYSGTNMPWNSYKSSIKSIVINSGVTTLGSNAFYNCTSVTSVTIANTVKRVNSWAFQNLSALTTISIPSSITYFGSGAFSGCSKLKEVKYASSATDWANIDFAGTTANPIYYAKGLKCNNSSTLTTSISYLGSSAVHKIKQYTFYNDTAITSLTFSSSVDTIDTYAFYGCNKITSKMEVPAVKYLGASAFSGCSSLTEFYVALQAPLTSYPSSLLYNCTSLTKVYIPRNVSSLGTSCFYNCSSLQYIYSSRLTAPTVGSNAFYGVPPTTQVKVLTSAASSNYKAASSWNSKFSSIGYFSTITTGSHTLTILSYDHDNSKFFVSTKYNTSKPALSGDITLPGSSLQASGVFYQYTYVPTTIVDNGYKDCTGITSVTIGNSYTTIGASAFSGCTELATVKFGSGSSFSSQCNISSIGNDAFTSCSKVANVYCYGGIAKWLNITFSNAIANPFYASTVSRTFYLNSTAASSISIPAGTTAIKNYAFYKNSTITSVEIPSSVTSFGTEAFYSCSNITSVNYLGEDATAWANIAFPGISANPVNFARRLNIGGTPLTDCYINGNVKQYTFYNDSLLTSVSFGSSVTSLGGQAFENCKNIVTLDMSEASSLTTIGYSVFDNCGNISGELYIPATVTSIGTFNFNDCSKVTAFYVTPTSAPTGVATSTFTSMVKTIPFYVSTPTALTNYSKASCWNDFKNMMIGGYCGASPNRKSVKWEFNSSTGLLTISGSGAMKDYATSSSNRSPWYSFASSVTSIKICDGVTYVGKFAFNDCSAATEVWMTTTVTECGASAFLNCSGLTKVYYGKTNTTSLSYATDWAQIDFGNSTANPLYYAQVLKNVTGGGQYGPIYSDVTSLENRNIDQIKKYAFYGCTSLTSAVIPSNVAIIEESAFYGCTNLATVTLPDALTTIDKYAFSNCAFSTITIPENVTNIVCCNGGTSYSIFNGCSALNTIVWNARNCSSTFAKIGKGANSYDYATPFESVKTQITSITFGENVERIPNYLCHGMTSLTSVTIPASVTSIGDETFDGCTGITSVTSLAETPPTVANSNTWTSVPTNATVTVMCPSIETAYKENANWSRFDTDWNHIYGACNEEIDENTNMSDLAAGGYYGDLTVKANKTLTMDYVSALEVDIKDLILEPGARIDLQEGASYTIDNLIMQRSGDGSTDNVATASIQGSLTAENLILDFTLDDSRWFPVSLPQTIAANSVTVDGVAQTPDEDYYALYFDGAKRASDGPGDSWEWVTGGNLNAHQGYLIGLPSGTKTLRFTMPEYTFAETANKNVSVAENASTRRTEDAGWNLIGNPYLQNYHNTTASMAVGEGALTAMVTMDIDGEYISYNTQMVADAVLPPFSACFIQSPATGSLIFTAASARNELRARNAARSAFPYLDVALKGNGSQDHTGFLVGDYNEEYKIGADMVKWYNDNYTVQAAPTLYSFKAGNQQAINARSEEMLTNIPVGYYATAAGSYTFTLGNEAADFDHVWLYDSEQQITTDLKMNSYEFTSQAGSIDHRFLLSASLMPENNEVATGVEDVRSETTDVVRSEKFLRDGSLFIIRDGKMYNAQGALVQ